MLNGNYETWRANVKDGTVLFFHRLGLRHALRDPLAIGGVLSNNGIAAVQYPASRARKTHNFIHVEMALWAEIMGERRLMCAGFTAEPPVGFKLRFASERLRNYRAPIVALSLAPTMQARFDADKAMAFIDSCIGTPYRALDLGKTVLPFWLWPPGLGYVCSSFIDGVLIAAGVEEKYELCWDSEKQEMPLRPARPQATNPQDLLQRRRLWGDVAVLK